MGAANRFTEAELNQDAKTQQMSRTVIWVTLVNITRLPTR
jgi:hypothetical protein